MDLFSLCIQKPLFNTVEIGKGLPPSGGAPGGGGYGGGGGGYGGGGRGGYSMFRRLLTI